MGSYRSKEDDVAKISTSIFVTNFPDSISAKDLFNACKTYGHVVDSFIPTKRAMNGKRFGFVRFINVFNVDRLVGNLCTVWIDRHKFFANVARFKRNSFNGSFDKDKATGGSKVNITKPHSKVTVNDNNSFSRASSFASVLKGTSVKVNLNSSSPAMVLDEECVVSRDLDNFVMGEVKDFSSINNLYVLLSNEGFRHVKLVYLGGLWVMIELASSKTKMRFMEHVGVASWFRHLCNAQADFVSRDRIVWIDIEGVPLHAWSRSTFTKIGSRWGEVIDLEDGKEDCFARKRICIKTCQEENILEKFKVIVRGKIFILRAKELCVWSLSFKDIEDDVYSSEDDYVKDVEENNVEFSKQVNEVDESDVEGVSDTFLSEQEEPLGHGPEHNQPSHDQEVSSDPFNLNDLLNKHGKDDKTSGTDSSIPFPPGFTP
ncbi:hypothetical protein CTI12_AA599330 [Artemisia annua]|uniref:RRM domain-containing protein n=1 Tax=Artemisia annua TaxID=35608 RepID=A0A2U1KIK6_ARTAN|nr:hypothetical protein CTI12_AA599330 [Artemisia annua]